jgi:phosphatidylinositol alpha-1,6-mannosyltransferase
VRLLVVSQDFPPHVGGIQTYALELARRLASACEVLEVIAPTAPGARELDRTLPFPVHRIRSSTNALAVTAAPTIMMLTRGRRFDAALHAQWTTAGGSLLARSRGRLRRAFVAVHGRELLLRPAARVPPVQRVYDALRSRVLLGADGVIAGSRYTVGLARDMGVDPRRLHLVSYGVDASRFDLPDATERAQRFRERHALVGVPFFATVARLQSHKGIDTGIAALPALRRRVPAATYVVVGSGPEAARLRTQAQQLGVTEAVRFLGRVSDDEVVDVLLACDAFALLSREDGANVEGFGLVLLEAGACGKPVLGARSGGIPDAVAEDDSGLLVPPDDVPATADALVQLLGDPKLARRLGEGGRRRARGPLGWDRAAQAYYETIAASLGEDAGSEDDEGHGGGEPRLRQ